MCDYSLQQLKSRPASVGDKLETVQFSGCITHGLAEAGGADPDTAVCVLPGTQLAFEDNISVVRSYLWFGEKQLEYKEAKFVQIDIDNPYAHHDAIELPDGSIHLIHNLVRGQTLTVLQLPPEPKTAEEAQAQERVDIFA